MVAFARTQRPSIHDAYRDITGVEPIWAIRCAEGVSYVNGQVKAPWVLRTGANVGTPLGEAFRISNDSHRLETKGPALSFPLSIVVWANFRSGHTASATPRFISSRKYVATSFLDIHSTTASGGRIAFLTGGSSPRIIEFSQSIASQQRENFYCCTKGSLASGEAIYELLRNNTLSANITSSGSGLDAGSGNDWTVGNIGVGTEELARGFHGDYYTAAIFPAVLDDRQMQDLALYRDELVNLKPRVTYFDFGAASAYQSATLKLGNGTGFVTPAVKVWNGSGWDISSIKIPSGV